MSAAFGGRSGTSSGGFRSSRAGGRVSIAAAACLLLAFRAGFPAPASAQEAAGVEAEARRLFDEGVAAFGREDYATALVAFQRAHEMSPRAFLLLNIGMCHRALLQFPAAIDIFRRYIEESGSAISPEKRREIDQFITEMEASLADVTVSVNEDGAIVFVDGTEVGASPLIGPLRLGPGTHVLEARKEGFGDARLPFSVMAGEATRVTLALSPLPPRDGGPGTGEEEESVLENPWLWVAVGAVVMGGAATTAVLLWPEGPEPAADWSIRGP